MVLVVPCGNSYVVWFHFQNFLLLYTVISLPQGSFYLWKLQILRFFSKIGIFRSFEVEHFDIPGNKAKFSILGLKPVIFFKKIDF